MNNLELTFLTRLDWNINVVEEEYERYTEDIYRFFHQNTMSVETIDTIKSIHNAIEHIEQLYDLHIEHNHNIH